MKNIAVILSGCGVYDGSEIHESVFTLFSIDVLKGKYQCFAPNILQHHVLNHVNGEEMNENRNVMIEAARIARGNIMDVSIYDPENFDALVIPGGFGAAKNLTKWAFQGPDGEINENIKDAILQTIKANKPIVGLCMGPTVIAKALEGTGISAKLTVGSSTEKSPYDIAAISGGMEKIGAQAEMKSIREFSYDVENKIITAPCYMLEGSISEVQRNIHQTIEKLFEII